MKPVLLFLSTFLPAREARQAGHKTAYRNLVWLAEKYRVHLLAFRSERDFDPGPRDLLKLCECVEVFPVTHLRRIGGLLLRGWDPLMVCARWQPAVAARVRNLVQEIRPVRFHCEGSQLGVYRFASAGVDYTTLNVHDILTQGASRHSRGAFGWFWLFEAARTRRWEARHYPLFSRVYVPSHKDLEWIHRLCPAMGDRSLVLDPHFDHHRLAWKPGEAGEWRMIFWGALGRRENSEAVMWLVREVFPLLRKEVPRAHLILAGSNPPKALYESAVPGIEMTGFVEDPATVFSRADVAVLPLFLGAGVKVKVLECLAAGLPVITTEIGAEGINATSDDGLLVQPSDASVFVRALVDLYRDHDRMSKLRNAALTWGERQQRDQRSILLNG